MNDDEHLAYILLCGLTLTNRTSTGIVSSRAYDALGRIVSTTDGRGNTSTYEYDTFGRQVAESRGNGASSPFRTTYAYDALGRQIAVTNALDHATYTDYDAEGRIVSTWGATYPVTYAYDAHGRMTAMNTFRDEAMEEGDTTAWVYDAATGLLLQKLYADGNGPTYTYTADGKLSTRTWARGITTTYAYDGAGLLLSVDYSDDTPDIAYTYDRLGRQLSAIAAGVSTNLFTYSGLDLVSETQNDVVINRTTDALDRPSGFSLGDDYGISYTYDTLGRFQSVAANGAALPSATTFAYSYLAGSDLISGMVASSGHAWTRSYEPARSLIAAVENRFGNTVVSRFDYKNDEIGRRISRADSGQAFDNPAFDVYSYNARSEVVGAQRYHGTNPADTLQPFGGREFGYAYDPIGNRTTATETVGGEMLAKSYSANELNQYTAISNPDAVGLRGSATNTATVTVNGNAASSDAIVAPWTPWHYALPADNANGGTFTFAGIMAVINPPGTNTPDIVSSESGHVYAPPQAETLAYDDDGNLFSDGRWQYTWNGENRLIKAEELVSPPTHNAYVVKYAYDHQGRMIQKTFAFSGQSPHKVIEYTWDSFNIIAEAVTQSGVTSTTYNIWGLDLDGTMQGAGGVGGLLAVISPLPPGEGQGEGSTVYLPCYDANGNITEYVSMNGAITAHREYDPFGGTVVATGNSDTFTHWLSTKPWCVATGLSEYQYRKYSPVMGRWLSRDPMEEIGGSNLCLFNRNNSLNVIDLMGLQSDDLTVYVDTFTDMFVETFFEATEYRLAEQSKVYKKLVAEMKDIVHEDIMRKIKSVKCCSSGQNIHGEITGIHNYGGKLFTVSLLASILTLNPLFVAADDDWGPLNYNFYTIGKMENDIRYEGSIGREPALGGILCCYSYNVTIKANIKDTFDFVPDHPNTTIKNKIYNIAASVWSSFHYDLMGASKPEVVGDVVENIQRSGCY
jgi:RHS repeat-associated protein